MQASSLRPPLSWPSLAYTQGNGELRDRRHGLLNPPTLVASVPNGRPITFSHLRVDSPGQAPFSLPAEAAYSIHLHLREATSYEIREAGRANRKECANAGSLSFSDLQLPQHALFHTPFHTIRSYVPLPALQEFAEQAGGRRQVSLGLPSRVSDDPILRHLFLCLRPILEAPEHRNSLFVDHIALALQAHLLRAYGNAAVERPSIRRGLAPWQERRAKEAMNASLGKDISIAQLATECGLSNSHFARAFRQATGRPPHRWLLERRLEVVQGLLLNSQMSLKEIASTCGFTDQSHLSRAFKRMVGLSPAAWRRIRSG